MYQTISPRSLDSWLVCLLRNTADNVAKLHTGHEYQITATDEFKTQSWVCLVAGKKVTTYKQSHYRVVLGTVGYSLRHFQDTEELLHSTYDVFTGALRINQSLEVIANDVEAMKEAWANASQIHRDISLGNIILVKEPHRRIRRGYLIDWESSSEIDESGQARIPGRSVSTLMRCPIW